MMLSIMNSVLLHLGNLVHEFKKGKKCNTEKEKLKVLKSLRTYDLIKVKLQDITSFFALINSYGVN